MAPAAPTPASAAGQDQDELDLLAALEQLDVHDEHSASAAEHQDQTPITPAAKPAPPPPLPPIRGPSGCDAPMDIEQVMQGLFSNVQETAEADPLYASDPEGAIQRAAGGMRNALPVLMRSHLQEISHLGGGQFLAEATKQRLRGGDFLPTRAEVSTALGVTLPDPAVWQGPRAYDAATPGDPQAVMVGRLRRGLRRDNWFKFCMDRHRPTCVGGCCRCCCY